MSLGSVFKNLLQKTKHEKPSVPPLDSKSNDIPKPNDPFSQNQNASENSLDDLPDFPDFPGDNNQSGSNEKSEFQDYGQNIPNPGINEPKPLSSSQGNYSQNNNFGSNNSTTASNAQKEHDIDYDLNMYETQNNDKLVGHPSVSKEGSDDFINIHDYKEVLECVDTLKDNLSAFDSSMMQLTDLNNNCATLEDSFKKTIEDIQRKLIFVDKTLFESHAK